MPVRTTTGCRNRSRTRYDDRFVSCDRPVVPSAGPPRPPPPTTPPPFPIVC
ncbi:hypothetical protein ABZ618_25265 [Streptomyces roseolus]|uniref:hypothetical protein n=1 Tax=Streptomyces roseolus TaxID=67358 RepID=UPI0033C91C04